MLHTVSRGDGPKPVLLIHGFLGTSRNLVSLGRRLCDTRTDWRVVLPDLRGHGISPPLREGDGLAALAADICALATELSAEPIDMIGHSLGGRVALAALAQAPERFARTTLIDIGPGTLPNLTGPMQRLFERLMGAPPAAPSRQDMRNFFLGGGIDAGLADWAMTNLDVGADGGVHWRFDRAALARLHWQEGGDDLWQVAQTYGARLHCIVGGRSGFVPPDDQQRFKDYGATVDVLPESGHFVHVDALNELTALVTQKATGA